MMFLKESHSLQLQLFSYSGWVRVYHRLVGQFGHTALCTDGVTSLLLAILVAMMYNVEDDVSVNLHSCLFLFSLASIDRASKPVKHSKTVVIRINGATMFP